MQILSTANSFLFHKLECTLLPPPTKLPFLGQLTAISKKTFTVICLTPLCTITGAIEIIRKITLSALNFFRSFFQKPLKSEPKMEEIARDPRLWDLVDQNTFNKKTPLGKGDPTFQYGIATCTYQDSGFVNCPDSQWADWEKKCVKRDNRSRQSANIFHLYKTNPKMVIDRLQKLGVTNYRFSIEWSHIEPRENEINNENLAIYLGFIRLLRQNQIECDLTLHHFSEPKWFHEKGSFLNEDNLAYFQRFTTLIGKKLRDENLYIKNFWTINEPGIEAFSRYIRGAFSPGESFQFKKAANFLKGCLKAHNLAYKALHDILGSEIKVGFTHQYLRFIEKNPLFYLVVRYLNKITNSMILQALKKGVFKLKIPFVCNIEEKLEILKDQMGVQVYTRPVIGFTGSTSLHGEEMTLMPFREDPASVYEAVKKVSEKADSDVVITETGISTNLETQRERFLSRALFAASKALEETNRLKGVFLWTFTHQLEWDMGMNPQRFSAYRLKFDGTIEDTYREGMKPFVETIRRWKTTHSEK